MPTRPPMLMSLAAWTLASAASSAIRAGWPSGERLGLSALTPGIAVDHSLPLAGAESTELVLGPEETQAMHAMPSPVVDG